MEREHIRVGNEVFQFLEALDIHDATDEMQAYVRALKGQPLVITANEMPIAVLIPVQGVDLEYLSMGTDPSLLDLLERSRRQVRDQGGISSEGIRRQLELPED